MSTSARTAPAFPAAGGAGLTKLEYAAVEIYSKLMGWHDQHEQAFLRKACEPDGHNARWVIEQTASLAWMLADALFARLDALAPLFAAAKARQARRSPPAAPAVETCREIDDVARMMGLEPIEPPAERPPWEDADADPSREEPHWERENPNACPDDETQGGGQ